MASFSPAPSAPPAVSAENSLFLFELIVCDLHWSAIQTGALGMMASAAVAATNSQGFKLSRHLAYDDFSVTRLALRFAVGIDLSNEQRNLLDRTYADLQQTVAHLKPFMTQDTLTPVQRELMRRLLPGLRRVALAAAETIERIEPLYRMRLDPGFAFDAAVIRKFLARAARGERDEFGVDGVLRLPQLRQRRKSPRLPIERPCRLALPVGEVAAVLLDVSREGVGLRSQSAVSLGQRVAVVIGARRLEANVARVEGDLVGLHLARPLQLSDPLFKAG